MALFYFMAAVFMSSEAQILLASGLIGFLNLPIYVLGYELAVAQAVAINKNIGEALSCGMINTLTNFLGFVMILVMTPPL